MSDDEWVKSDTCFDRWKNADTSDSDSDGKNWDDDVVPVVPVVPVQNDSGVRKVKKVQVEPRITIKKSIIKANEALIDALVGGVDPQSIDTTVIKENDNLFGCDSDDESVKSDVPLACNNDIDTFVKSVSTRFQTCKNDSFLLRFICGILTLECEKMHIRDVQKIQKTLDQVYNKKRVEKKKKRKNKKPTLRAGKGTDLYLHTRK